MEYKVGFIGHRKIFCNDLIERLIVATQHEIYAGCRYFIMGVHGDFDRNALFVCRQLRKEYKAIKIEIAITSLNHVKKLELNSDLLSPYNDVDVTMFDTDNIHFERIITETNKRMIDCCSTIICYIDAKRNPSGAKTAINYARRKGKKIINLFKKEDNPFYGKSEEERKMLIENAFRRIKNQQQ